VRDVVVGRAHLDQVEGAVLHLAELVDLPVRGEDAGAVGLQLAVLDDHSELHAEPEHAREEAQVLLVAQAVGRFAGEPVQLRERRRGEQVPVPEDLVDDVRLGRVQRHRGVAHVLRGVEDPLRQRAVEVAQRHQPGGRHVAEARDRAQPLAHQVEAGHAVGGEVERRLRLEELADRELLVLGGDLAAHGPPDLLLGVVVAHVGRGLARLPRERERRDLVAPGLVVRVAGAGVVVAEVDGDLAVSSSGHGRIELSLLEHCSSAALAPPVGKCVHAESANCLLLSR
jgi:hypothetical protein